MKLIFHISWLHGISFTYNPTASFFRNRIVEWIEIVFKMRPTLFKKSWNLFYSDVIGCPVNSLINSVIIYCRGNSRYTFFAEPWWLYKMTKNKITECLKFKRRYRKTLNVTRIVHIIASETKMFNVVFPTKNKRSSSRNTVSSCL